MNSKEIQSFYDGPNRNAVEDGHEFEDFARFCCIEKGLITHTNKSAKYQITQGENPQGIEFKRDNISIKTDRYSIEFENKSKTHNKWKPSGILGWNHWCYVQGNEKFFHVFASKLLQYIYYQWKYDLIDLDSHIEPTVKGFYLPLKRADELCLFKYPDDFYSVYEFSRISKKPVVPTSDSILQLGLFVPKVKNKMAITEDF
jgi:hypothetical protein